MAKKKPKNVYGEGSIFYSNVKKKWMAQINVGKDENGNDVLLSLKEADVGAIYLGKTATDFTVYSDDISDRRPVAKVRSSGIYLHEDGRSGIVHQMDF